MGFFIKVLSRIANGLAANDGTGDPLRTGGDKINANYDVIVDTINALASGAASNMLSFSTKAAMDADTSRPDGTLARVLFDATPANNRTYAWVATTPAWVAAQDAVAYDLTSTATGKGAALVFDRARVPPEKYGAKVDGITDDLVPLNAAITAAGKIGGVGLSGDYFASVAPTNKLGVEYVGPGRILNPVTGGNAQLNSHADEGQHVFGREYLYAFLQKLRLTRSAKIVASGDSTTECTYITSAAKYKITNLIQSAGMRRGFDCPVTNAGHSSKHTGDWLTTYVTGDIASAPDLYIVRWGINDPYYGRTIDQFATDLRAGLAQFRATYTTSQASILLCVPSSTYDVPNGRDEKWYEQARLVVRQAARDYDCCCIDLYALIKDARWGAGTAWDNAFGDGRGIHPMETLNMVISSAIADVIYPSNFNFNMTASAEYTVSSSTPPSAYPLGWSMYFGTADAAGVGWGNVTPMVVTWRGPDGRVTQRISVSNFSGASAAFASAFFEREGVVNTSAGLDGWNYWRSKRWEAVPTLQNGWTAFTGSAPYMKIINNTVMLGGLINSGTLTAGTVLFTLPVGMRPRNNPEIFLQQCGTTGAVTTAMVRVTSDGNVTLLAGGVAGFLSLSGVTFDAGT